MTEDDDSTCKNLKVFITIVFYFYGAERKWEHGTLRGFVTNEASADVQGIIGKWREDRFDDLGGPRPRFYQIDHSSASEKDIDFKDLKRMGIEDINQYVRESEITKQKAEAFELSPIMRSLRDQINGIVL